MRDIKYNLGHNFIRTAHYPQDPFVYEFCDRHGLIVCEEVPNIKHLKFSDEIQEKNLREMIRRDRNHPSIALWSLGNETHDAADEKWALQEDRTRIIHCRKARGRGSEVAHDHNQIDMENLLRCTVRGWYNQDVKPCEPEEGQHAGHERWQHDRAMVSDGSIRGRIDRQGVMWIYADHGADRVYVNCPLKYINPKGWVDAYRIPKYLYYLWQANWCEKPMVYIHPFEWTERYLGRKRDITVNSNCDSVELEIDGVKQECAYPCKSNFYTVCFKDITVRSGAITAIGEKDGEKVTHSLTMPGKPAALRLSTSQHEITADRAGIALVKVDIVDESGVHVYGARNNIRLEISGPGALTTPQEFYSDIDKNEETEGTMYIDAPFCVPVRSTATAGMITITASSRDLDADSIQIKSTEPEEREISGIKTLYLPDRPESVSDVDEIASFTEEDQWEGGLSGTRMDFDFTKAEPAEYGEMLDERIRMENRDVEFDPIIYKIMKELLLDYIGKGQGILVRDDYNFLIQRFNQCHRLCNMIDTLDMPAETKKKLKGKYAIDIIQKRINVDFFHEKNKLIRSKDTRCQEQVSEE